MPDNIKALRGYIKDRVLYGDSAFFATEDAESCADEIEQLRERCTYFYEALHDIALGAHGNDGVEFARKAIGFIKLEFDADKIAAANDLINRAALGENK